MEDFLALCAVVFDSCAIDADAEGRRVKLACVFTASDAEHAAELWGEVEDAECDYVVQQDGADVMIKPMGSSDDWTRYSVTAEQTVLYSASVVEG